MLKFLRRRSDGTVISVDDASTEYARRTRDGLASDGAVDTVVPAPWEEVSVGGGSSFAHLTEDADAGIVVADAEFTFLVATLADALAYWNDGAPVPVVEFDAGSVIVQSTNADSSILQARVGGEATPRCTMHTDGSLHWGDGSAAPDLSLGREEAFGQQAAFLRGSGAFGPLLGVRDTSWGLADASNPTAYLWGGLLEMRSPTDTPAGDWKILDTRRTDEFENRFAINGDGSLHWGDGATAPDTHLARATATDPWLDPGSIRVEIPGAVGMFKVQPPEPNDDNTGIELRCDGSVRFNGPVANAGFNTTDVGGVLENPWDGGGFKLRSPDGTQTKTLRLSNAGAIELV